MPWKIDPNHSSVEFAVRYFGISLVRGLFRKFDGTLEVDLQGAITVNATIEADSIDTNQAQRDQSLRGEHFFGAEQYPTIRFIGTSDSGMLNGQLTMRGVTRPVSLRLLSSDGPMRAPTGEARRGAAAEGVIHRSEWGVSGNMALPDGNPAIGDEVFLRLDVEAIES